MEKNEIIITYGTQPDTMARNILEEVNLADLIGEKTRKIGIKPNLVSPSPANNGATTHAGIVDALLQYLRENRFENIVLIEGSGLGKSTVKAVDACGYRTVLEKYQVEFVDTKKDSYQRQTAGGKEFEISWRALGLDFLINLPVMKGHCQTLLTCALKNNKGLLSDGEKRRFHAEVFTNRSPSSTPLSAPTSFWWTPSAAILTTRKAATRWRRG